MDGRSIIILISMLRKTTSSQVQSTSAKTEIASFTVPSKREMYKESVASDGKINRSYSNVLVLNPEQAAFTIADHVHVLEDGESFVSLHDAHYALVSHRGRAKMIQRAYEPDCSLLFSHARQPGALLYLESLHRCSNQDYPDFLHFNTTKYNPEDNTSEVKNIYLQVQGSPLITSFSTIENCKKAIILKKLEQECELVCVSLTEDNKMRNPRLSSSKKRASESSLNDGILSEREQIITPPDQISHKLSLQPGESIIKVINSEFGDVLLLITTADIYNVQISREEILIKPLGLLQQLRALMHSQTNPSGLKDASYVIDSLKLVFLTNTNVVGYINDQKVTNFYDLAELTANKNCPCGFEGMKLHSLASRLIVESENQQVFILQQLAQGQMAFDKMMELPVKQPQILSYKFGVIPRDDHMLLQLLTKDPNYKLEVRRKSILAAGEEFTDMLTTGYKGSIKHPNEHLTKSHSPRTKQKGWTHGPVCSTANGIACTLNHHEISFMRIYQGFTTERNQVEELFSVSFFNLPLTASIDPYGSTVIILFRQFIKFFKFDFTALQSYYTHNVRGANYASFADGGRYIMVHVDDVLYFINPYSYETEETLEVHGEVKDVRLHEDSLYIALRSKNSKHLGHEHFISTFIKRDGQYHKISDRQLEIQSAFLTNCHSYLIADKNSIQVYSHPHQSQSHHPKLISLAQNNEYPTTMTLSEEFGFLLVGTNQGRLYEYVWPFNAENSHTSEVYSIKVSESEVTKIQIGACLEKMYIYNKEQHILQMEIIQYIQGSQMSNLYVISNKQTAADYLKYQFGNRGYLYQNYTAFVYGDLRALNDKVEQLQFMGEKLNDDLEEQARKAKDMFIEIRSRKTEEHKRQQNRAAQQLSAIKQQNSTAAEDIKLRIEDHRKAYEERFDQQVKEYEKRILQLYKESERLQNTHRQLSEEFERELNTYAKQNKSRQQLLTAESVRKQSKFISRFIDIDQQAHELKEFESQEIQECDMELTEYNRHIYSQIEAELEQEEQTKESLLGSIQHFGKEIANYKQRKDQFYSLIMETGLQTEELKQDRAEYSAKKQYLRTELLKKEETIQEKQRELVMFVAKSHMMKKMKNTHEFQLKEEQKCLQPIQQKMAEIDKKIQTMNKEIFAEFHLKQDREHELRTRRSQRKQLHDQLAKRELHKQQTIIKVDRLLATLAHLLEDPFHPALRDKLNDVVNGEKYVIDEEEIKRRKSNTAIMRKKEHMRKEIEEQEKRDQQIVKNKNIFYHYYNDNTSLVRYYNELKQEHAKLEAQQKMLRQQIEKTVSRLETPKHRSNSLRELKKHHGAKMTPFQLYEQEQSIMHAKGNSIQTKLTRTDKSASLLQSLIKDFDKSESRYEKVEEVIRDRVRSFVNPELRIRKTMNAQKALFDRQRGQTNRQPALN